jgi:hypothetical protein
VVRERLGWEAALSSLLTRLITVAINGYVLMVIAAAVTPWHPSYWHSILAFVGARVVLETRDYLEWTQPAKRGKR